MGRNLSVDTVRVMSGLLGRQGGGGGDAEAEGTEGHWEEKSDSGHVDCAVLELTLSLSLSHTTEKTEQQLENEWSELESPGGPG